MDSILSRNNETIFFLHTGWYYWFYTDYAVWIRWVFTRFRLEREMNWKSVGHRPHRFESCQQREPHRIKSVQLSAIFFSVVKQDFKMFSFNCKFMFNHCENILQWSLARKYMSTLHENGFLLMTESYFKCQINKVFFSLSLIDWIHSSTAEALGH